MFWHIDTDFVSLIVIIAIYVYNLKNPPHDESVVQQRSFLWSLRSGIVVTVIDIAASMAMDFAVSRFVYHLFMTLYLATVELPILCWLSYSLSILYHTDPVRRRNYSLAVRISYLVYVPFALTNPWTGLMYTLGENNEYQRGPLFFLMVAVYAAYAAVLLALVLIRRRYVPIGYSTIILVMMPLINALAIAVQLLCPGLLLIMPGFTISMLLAFLFLQTRRTRDSEALVSTLSAAATTDQMTDLLNRAGMEQQVLRLSRDCSGQKMMVVVVDIDDLKSINDSFGHTDGDLAIRTVATHLKSHFRASDLVARFGGDEFIVCLVGNLSDSQSRCSLELLVDEITRDPVGEGGRVVISVSVGAAMGVVGYDDFYSLCRRADAALYYVKQHHKHGCAFYEPSMELRVFDKGSKIDFRGA